MKKERPKVLLKITYKNKKTSRVYYVNPEKARRDIKVYKKLVNVIKVEMEWV